MDLQLLLTMAADAAGDRVAVGPRDGGTTYAELLAHARADAARLQRAGVEVAGMLDETSLALPVQLFSCAFAGVPFAPLNYRLDDVRLEAAVEELAPMRLLVGPEQQGRVSTKGVEVVGREDVLAVDNGEEPTDSQSEVAILLFTSGTSGPPKVVRLKHAQLAAYVINTVDFLAAGPGEAILISVPPYHIAGVSSVLSSVYAGRRMVQLPNFTAQRWVDLAEEEAVTHAMVVPTMLERILGVLADRGTGLPSLQHLSYGGGRMPAPLIERALELLPEVDFVNAYGLTETASTIAVLTPNDHRAALNGDDPAVRSRLGSVGRPLPGIDIDIRDESGQSVDPGKVGELFVRGDQVSGEYRSHSALDEDGWFPTRDRARRDDDGYLYLEGRADDVIVRGGENISPGEVEDVLHAHPGVADVAVVGVPDEEWGEEIAACIVLEDGHEPSEDELRAWVRDRLRSSRTPGRVDVVDQLPRTELGKLRRAQVRAALTDS